MCCWRWSARRRASRPIDGVSVRLSVPRRARDHPVFPRPRLARGRRAGCGARLRVRRRGERAPAAHRAGHQPCVSADRIVAALARARPLVLALRRARRHGGRPDRARARPGRAARGLCAGRLRVGALARRHGQDRARAREPDAADRRRHRGRSSSSRCRCCSPNCWRCARTARNSPSSRPGAARCTGPICSRSSSPDLFGAMDRQVDFWGAGGFAWNERFGMADLFLAQNMGLLYSGALVPIAADRRRRRAAGCGRARSASSPSRRC